MKMILVLYLFFDLSCFDNSKIEDTLLFKHRKEVLCSLPVLCGVLLYFACLVHLSFSWFFLLAFVSALLPAFYVLRPTIFEHALDDWPHANEPRKPESWIFYFFGSKKTEKKLLLSNCTIYCSLHKQFIFMLSVKNLSFTCCWSRVSCWSWWLDVFPASFLAKSPTLELALLWLNLLLGFQPFSRRSLSISSMISFSVILEQKLPSNLLSFC